MYIKCKVNGSIAVVLSAVFALVCGLLMACMVHPGEGFVYSLDDSYIHLALAKNLAETGVWGLSPERYAFCSSSPLWTTLLSGAFAIFGYCELLPLILSLLSCIGSIWIVDSFFLRHNCSTGCRVVAECLWMVACQLPVMGLLGMEHSLHVFLIAALVDSADRLVGDAGRKYECAWLVVFAGLSVAARYESMFLVVPLTVLLLCARRWKASVVVLLCATLPIVLYGAYSCLHGGTFLPNTLMVKGNSFNLDRVVVESLMPYLRVNNRNYLTFLMMLITAGVAVRKSTPKVLSAALIGIFVAEVGHLTFVGNTAFRRYESYLLSAAFMCIAPSFADISIKGMNFARRFAIAAAVLAFVFPFADIFVRNCDNIIQGSSDVCCQQVQLARIFSALPAKYKAPVAINDIGVMALRGGVQILDVAGLADREVAELWRDLDHYHAGTLELMKRRGVKYMAVFNGWFPKEAVPSDMIMVGSLVNPDNYICAESCVYLYASGPEYAAALRAAMLSISQSLPYEAFIE